MTIIAFELHATVIQNRLHDKEQKKIGWVISHVLKQGSTTGGQQVILFGPTSSHILILEIYAKVLPRMIERYTVPCKGLQTLWISSHFIVLQSGIQLYLLSRIVLLNSFKCLNKGAEYLHNDDILVMNCVFTPPKKQKNLTL
jgi:hypothetical protein